VGKNMSDYNLKNGLYVPKVKPEDMPSFSVRTFICYYESDAERFQKIVEAEGGKFETYLRINHLNYKNQPVGFGQFVCIYQFYKDIEMEVLT
jgi:hypothetical protein